MKQKLVSWFTYTGVEGLTVGYATTDDNESTGTATSGDQLLLCKLNMHMVQ